MLSLTMTNGTFNQILEEQATKEGIQLLPYLAWRNQTWLEEEGERGVKSQSSPPVDVT